MHFPCSQVEARLSAVSAELQTAEASNFKAVKQRKQVQSRVNHDQTELTNAKEPFVLKKLFFPGICAKRLARREAKLHTHLNDLTQVSTVRRSTSTHVHDAAARRAALAAQVQHLGAARTETSQLLNQVLFNEAGNAPYSICDPQERSLATQTAASRVQHASLQVHMERYVSALAMLQHALADLEQSLQLLANAESMTQMDAVMSGLDLVFGDPYRHRASGMMLTMYEREQARSGIARARQASERIITAYQMFPGGIPHINLQALQQLGPDFFAVFFNNVFSDLMLLQLIGENMTKVRVMQREVARAASWMKGTLERDAKPDLARAAAQLTALTAALDAHRRNALQAALTELKTGPVQGMPVQKKAVAEHGACSKGCAVVAVAAEPATASCITVELL